MNIDYNHIFEILNAMKEGRQIQVEQYENVWCDLKDGDFPSFKYANFYRIKPEVKKYRVGLIDPKTAPIFPLIIKDEESAKRLEQASGFVRWSTNWIEY